MLLRCTVNGDVALYISNTMHPFRFHSSLCPRCCYYQSWHHSFDMTGPVFPFICNGQEILNHFIFQAQQHLFFKKWLSSLSVSISCFLPCLISCAMFICQSFYSLSPVLFCFCAHPCNPFLSLSLSSLSSHTSLVFLSLQGTGPGLLHSTKRCCWLYQPWFRTT